MASRPHLDDDDDFGGDFPAPNTFRRSGQKRGFGDIDDDEDDIFGSKKGNVEVEETALGKATGMILSLRESLQSCNDTLTTCQADLEAAKSEIQKWHSAFQNESLIQTGTSFEPKVVVAYLQTLKSSEESLREQLEKAKKKEATFIVTVAKREQEIAELKARRLLLDLAIHEEFTRLKIHELSMKFALQKYQNVELRSQFKGLCKHMEGLTNDVEKSNDMVSILQEKLEDKDAEIKHLRQELHQKNSVEETSDLLVADTKTSEEGIVSAEAENENL